MTASALTRPGERDRLTVKFTQIDWRLLVLLCAIAGMGASFGLAFREGQDQRPGQGQGQGQG